MPGGGTLTFATGRTHLGQDRLEAWPNVSPGPFARVSVIDTGQGMDSATLGRMFDPFFTTKAPGKGTGLGLAMVYGIVQGHGGVIECQSRPGRGTRFDLYWPITPMIPTDASKTGDGDAKSAGGSETILVVDDEPDLVALTRAFLTSVGYNVLTAASGEEAMEIMAARGREVDLVILDMGLPGMGGPACLERLRETRPELRVLIASGYVDGIQSMGQPLRDLQTAFIGKPFRFEALLHRLRELLDSAGSPTAKPTGEE
jgi:CheY-like chemotaxis protein